MEQKKIEIRNLVPKFLAFYEKAKGKDNDIVWDLWQENYNFAAVPPGDEGQKMAKDMLFDAWEKYDGIVSDIEKWTPDIAKVEKYLHDVKELLECEIDIDMLMIYFVGGFEGNPFVVPTREGGIALGWPVEVDLSDINLAHELAHIVHSSTAKFNTSWERSIGLLSIQEGLAMHVSKHLVPGETDEVYVEYSEGWLNECNNNADEILDGILVNINESSYEKVYQFTMGKGTTGQEREAYYAGWIIVERLLSQGMTFEEISKLRESEIPEVVRSVIS